MPWTSRGAHTLQSWDMMLSMRSTINGVDANRYLIEHPAYAELATMVVYTEGQTPEETCDMIVERL